MLKTMQLLAFVINRSRQPTGAQSRGTLKSSRTFLRGLTASFLVAVPRLGDLFHNSEFNESFTCLSISDILIIIHLIFKNMQTYSS